MVRYIEEVVVKYTQGRACVLIWDVYKSHMTDEVMQTEATMLLDIMHVKAAADPRRMLFSRFYQLSCAIIFASNELGCCRIVVFFNSLSSSIDHVCCSSCQLAITHSRRSSATLIWFDLALTGFTCNRRSCTFCACRSASAVLVTTFVYCLFHPA
jgi:hypothetical protein